MVKISLHAKFHVSAHNILEKFLRLKFLKISLFLVFGTLPVKEKSDVIQHMVGSRGVLDEFFDVKIIEEEGIRSAKYKKMNSLSEVRALSEVWKLTLLVLQFWSRIGL